MTNDRTYWVDGEIGRFEFQTHQILHEDTVLYNTAQEVFPRRGCWEWYKTKGFKEIALIHGATEKSYQKTARVINRMRYQEGTLEATPMRTIRASVVHEGHQILDYIERKTTDILRREGFSDDGRPVQPQAADQATVRVVPIERVREAILACDLCPEEQAAVAQHPVLYEQAAHSVNIFLDDVVVKRQKDVRAERQEASGPSRQQPPAGTDTRKYVHNTVAHIQHEERSYTVNGQGFCAVLRIILGYLLYNELLQYRLQFFVDGQKTLHAAILRTFSWFTNIGLLLDWYHLEDKCRRQLSLAMKGKQIRNAVLPELTRLLWYGLVDHAIAYLEGLQDELMKQPDAVRVLIGYLDRNRPYLPCYAVRKQLGLRNSSNLGEKMNDLLVSDRQKHHGMSWSPDGSVALAALEAIKRNHEYHLWFEHGELEWKWAA